MSVLFVCVILLCFQVHHHLHTGTEGVYVCILIVAKCAK